MSYLSRRCAVLSQVWLQYLFVLGYLIVSTRALGGFGGSISLRYPLYNLRTTLTLYAGPLLL